MRNFRLNFWVNLIIIFVAIYVSCYGWWASISQHFDVGDAHDLEVIRFGLIHFNKFNIDQNEGFFDIEDYVILDEMNDNDCKVLWDHSENMNDPCQPLRGFFITGIVVRTAKILKANIDRHSGRHRNHRVSAVTLRTLETNS